MRHSRGPDFSVLHLEIHVLGHNLDTFYAPLARTQIGRFVL